jgi:carbamate kinase
MKLLGYTRPITTEPRKRLSVAPPAPESTRETEFSAPSGSQLGLLGATALVVGSIVGVGIFNLPSSLAPYGPITLVSMGLTTIGALALAWLFASLARRMPAAGGPYAYARVAFGNGLGFANAWSYWITAWAGNAAIAVGWVLYVEVFINKSQSKIWTILLVLAGLWIPAFINLSGLKNMDGLVPAGDDDHKVRCAGVHVDRWALVHQERELQKTEGQIGYVLELELDNAIPDQDTVKVLTSVVVDPHDAAFSAPSKFIGPVYAESKARAFAERHGWTVRPDGQDWRRVVPSPQPLRIVQLHAIERLIAGDFLVICTGGGGIPVIEDERGHQRGVEAVIDKDLASALLASDLDVDTLVLATDVDAVYEEYGTPAQRPIVQATPEGLRAHHFAAGSMGPKGEAVCRFVERTGARPAIGRLDELDDLLAGRTGTQVLSDGPELRYGEREAQDDRAA